MQCRSLVPLHAGMTNGTTDTSVIPDMGMFLNIPKAWQDVCHTAG